MLVRIAKCRQSYPKEAASGRRSFSMMSTSPCGKGEIVGLLGRSGSGKSTLLRIVSGPVETDGGRCALAR